MNSYQNTYYNSPNLGISSNNMSNMPNMATYMNNGSRLNANVSTEFQIPNYSNNNSYNYNFKQQTAGYNLLNNVKYFYK